MKELPTTLEQEIDRQIAEVLGCRVYKEITVSRTYYCCRCSDAIDNGRFISHPHSDLSLILLGYTLKPYCVEWEFTGELLASANEYMLSCARRGVHVARLYINCGAGVAEAATAQMAVARAFLVAHGVTPFGDKQIAVRA